MELTRQDFDVLLEAVEAWESKDLAGDLMEGMFTSMLCKPEDQERHKLELEKKQAKRDVARKVRRERSVLLRAKLITIRDEMDVNAAFDRATE